MKNRNLALFDFDGTITRHDTFIQFVKFAKGKWQFLLGFGLLSPMLVLMRLKLYPNWRAKERVMSFFFSGMSASEFNNICHDFAENKIPDYVRPSALNKIIFHKDRGDTIVIITASFENWVRGWAKSTSDLLIGTKVEIVNDKLSGKISGKNCYGIEKVNRLKDALDTSEFTHIYAYGDSRGDREMLSFSTHPNYKVLK